MKFLSREDQTELGVNGYHQEVSEAKEKKEDKTEISETTKKTTKTYGIDTDGDNNPDTLYMEETEESIRSLTLGDDASITFEMQEDSPPCDTCGSIMVRNGSCYKCLHCGSTSGCS